MADPQNKSRKLSLTFSGAGVEFGGVPLVVVAAKLQALQSLVFHAAATVTNGARQRRGQWFNKYREQAELTFVDAHHSNLIIEAEVPLPSTLADSPAGEVGLAAVDLVFRFASAAIHDGDIPSLVADRQDRIFLLRALEGLCPATTDDYSVELQNGRAGHARVGFSGETRQLLRRRVVGEVAPNYEQRQETLVGVLTKIHVDTAPQLIAVRVSRAEVDCYFDDSFRDQISNLVAGSVVEVTGLATFDRDGAVKQLDAVVDVEMVSMEPLRVVRFEHDGTWYKLKEPLIVSVEYQDGLWAYQCDAVNLWGYAARREDAVRDLHENFDYLWREFALERDDAFDDKAILIKRKLLGLVENVPGGPVNAA